MMKSLFYKRWQKTIGMFLLTVMLNLSLPILADDGWVLVFQNAYGEEQQISMANVGSFVAVDDAYDFTILSTSGEVLAEGILKASFQSDGTDNIKPVRPSGNIIARAASDKLTMIGVKGEVTVYNSAGIVQNRITATGGETVVSIGHLPSGIYIVKTSTQSFKFIKK